MASWQIERFDKARHQRSGFSSGKEPLDHFLRELATQYEKRRLGRTYVTVLAGTNQVLGYYTLAAGSLSFEELPAKLAKKLPKHPIPTLLLARLAVDQSVQGKGLGRQLLVDALQRCHGISQAIGIHLVQVDAIDDQAQAFYLKYGFTPLLDHPNRLFLPIETIVSAFSS